MVLSLLSLSTSWLTAGQQSVQQDPGDAKHTYLSTFIYVFNKMFARKNTIQACQPRVAANNVDKNTTWHLNNLNKLESTKLVHFGPFVEHTLGTTIQQVLINTL